MYEELLESSEFYQKRYHNFSTRLILPVFGLLVFFVIFLIFMKKEITLQSTATIEPVKVLSQIQSTSNNKIKTNNLSENATVKEGDLLIEYASEIESVQKENAEQQLESLNQQKSQLELLKTSIENDSNQFDREDSFGYLQRFEDYLSQKQTLAGEVEQENSTISSQNSSATETQNTIGNIMNDISQKIADYQTLKNAISSGETIDSSNTGYFIYLVYNAQNLSSLNEDDKAALKTQTISQIDTQINQLQTELSSYQIQYSSSGTQQAYNSSLDSQLSSLKAQKIAEVSQEMTALDQRIQESACELELQKYALDATKILSTNTGIVHVNPEVIDSEIISEGTTIAQIYPSIEEKKEVNIETYIPSDAISTLEVGDEVKFKMQDSANNDTTLTSKITSIDSNATQTEEGNYFKVIAKTRLSKKQVGKLKYGISGNLVIITGKKTYFNYYIDQFLN
ncbi:bacteriocin secretion accessory protein [Streptococcus sp. H49]|uniref:bacteriocin secretion accessory protein n=1 Tax=Streptococcus huangxiaojuni TaxID=3237239 RepID=UPI0034A560B5